MTIIGSRYAVNISQKFKRIDRRYIPPKLGSLSKHDTDFFNMCFSSFPRGSSVDLTGSTVRCKNSAEDFNGRRFSSPIWTNIADHFTIGDRKRNVIECGNQLILSIPK